MAYNAQVIKDSIAPSGFRLTTMVLTYPRFVHSEFMTHRAFSRNAASSRAIPIEKMIRAIQDDPVTPVWWGKAQTGMQAHEEIGSSLKHYAIANWNQACHQAIINARGLANLGVHKQIANRLLEPFSWITVIVTGNPYAYENFFALRCHPDAQPELQKAAYLARDAYYASQPNPLNNGLWHLPFFSYEDAMEYRNIGNKNEIFRKISVARCARVSYLTHDGKREISEDLRLFERLKVSGHWSPFEHVAMATQSGVSSGNFVGWIQFRKTFEFECRKYHFTPQSPA